jgi:hypothetical protein
MSRSSDKVLVGTVEELAQTSDNRGYSSAAKQVSEAVLKDECKEGLAKFIGYCKVRPLTVKVLFYPSTTRTVVFGRKSRIEHNADNTLDPIRF